MKSDRNVKKRWAPLSKRARLVLLMAALGATSYQRVQAATNVVIWDTGSRFGDTVEAETRTAWKAVPSELFVLEAEPAKAASDPGYYGREYSFKGDAVVENQRFAAFFLSARGAVAIYSQTGSSAPTADGTPSGLRGPGKRLFEFAPLQSGAPQGKISRCEILRNAADEVIVEAFFSATGTPDTSVVFHFGKTDIIEIKPGAKMKGMSLLGPIEYGVVPGFIGDDLIFSAADGGSAGTVAIPSENVFVGLLKGEDSEFVMTWPKGKQRLNLRLAGDPQSKRAITSIDFENDDQSFCVAALSAPGLWHEEALKPAYLEKDVALKWKPPFAARWKTQLSEAGVKTTFAFRESKGTIWRGVPGSYNYPAWFDGGTAYFHLSKKVPPKGDALIYFLEGQGTPPSIATPVDLVQATLGRQLSGAILDAEGRKLRTHHRRGGDGVHRACTCGCTEAIQAVFEAKQELTRQDYVQEALGDMKFFVDCHVERIDEYQRFAAGLIQFFKAKSAAVPELKSYLEGLEPIVQQIPQEYSVQKENMKSPEYMSELARKTMALTASKGTNNLSAYMELLKAWRAMGGAQDYVVAQCHTLTRKLFQEAGYGCVNEPKAVVVAQEIRARCRQVLRNPDGYEIWGEY